MFIHHLAKFFHLGFKRQSLCYAVAENNLTVFIRVNTNAEMTDTVVKLLSKVAVLAAGDRLHLEAAGIVCAWHDNVAKLNVILDI